MPQKNNNIIVLTAPSGTGKTSIISAIIKKYPHRFTFSISHTTRYQRNYEIEGKDYYFINENEFKKMIKNNEFLEWAQIGSYYYGTAMKEIEKMNQLNKKMIFDIDVQGFRQLKSKNIPALYLFIKPPNLETLEKRLKKRNSENDSQIKKRILLAKNEMKFEIEFDHVIMNDNFDECLSEIETIVLE